MSAHNPLIEDAFPIPFDRIRPDHVEPAISEHLKVATERLQRLEQPPQQQTFDNTIVALENVTLQLDRALHIVGHLEAVASTPELREAYGEALPLVSAFTTQIPLSTGLWNNIKRYAASAEAKSLVGPQKRLLRKTVSYFKRHGADLEPAQKDRFAALDIELTKVTLQFSRNVLDASNAFELLLSDETQLAGLPDNAQQAAKESAEQAGKAGWRFTLQAPSIVPALTYLDDAQLRETLLRAIRTRATGDGHDNRPLVAQILALRAEKAELLGYQDFADFVTEERMAKTGAKARQFLDDLRARSQSSFEAEKVALASFRRDLEPAEERPLQAWDVAYYAEKQRKKRYNFDGEALRPYFAFKKVIQGLFQIAGELYGLSFEPYEQAPTWHPSVLSYKMIDQGSKRMLAHFYVDPFPRDSKRAGAWMDGLVARGQLESDKRHVAVLAANISPPIGDGPALLSHAEVETMFHEFGHLLHHCLSAAALSAQAGTRVAWDFVELPSQIFENWCWEREALDLFAEHHESSQRIPEELLTAMRKARTFRAGSQQMRQLALGCLDLSLHCDFQNDQSDDVLAYAREIMAPFAPTPLLEDDATVASFEHLFADPLGYAAGYYSYKWAEVLDADAFTRFQKEGLVNPKVGEAFREQVLARGDEEAPEVLFRRFVGRDPDLGALLQRLGLAH